MQTELIVVIVSAILGGVITYILTKHFREKKSLAYEVMCESSLINVSPKIKDKIRIEWDRAEIKDVSSFKVRLINDGNEAIKSQPVLFSFEKGSWIVDWDYATKPDKEFGNIEKIEAEENPHEVKIVVDLMNPKEEIEFNFLTADSKGDFLRLYAKGEDLRFHRRMGAKSRWRIAMFVFSGLMVFLFAVAFVFNKVIFENYMLFLIIAIGILTIGLVLSMGKAELESRY